MTPKRSPTLARVNAELKEHDASWVISTDQPEHGYMRSDAEDMIRANPRIVRLLESVMERTRQSHASATRVAADVRDWWEGDKTPSNRRLKGVQAHLVLSGHRNAWTVTGLRGNPRVIVTTFEPAELRERLRRVRALPHQSNGGLNVDIGQTPRAQLESWLEHAPVELGGPG